jgi:hypothetical protein
LPPVQIFVRFLSANLGVQKIGSAFIRVDEWVHTRCSYLSTTPIGQQPFIQAKECQFDPVEKLFTAREMQKKDARW